MEAAYWPFKATVPTRARRPPMLSADAHRVLSLVASSLCFVTGCWLGTLWVADAPPGFVMAVGKLVPLLAGPVLLLRRRSTQRGTSAD
jgi:hypothetical protein